MYADNGVYAVEVCVADDDDAITCDSLAVTVANAAPGVNAGDDVTIVAGQTFGMTGAFSDAGAADTHSAEVNWDDESVNEVATVTQGSGSGTAAAFHQYLVAGIYTVQLCVTDDDGGVSCDDLTLEVISAAEATARFVDYLDSFDLPAGIENSLLSKLQGALESFEAGDDKQGLNQLKAFINAVEAQDGKKVDGEDASALVSMAEQIMDGVVSQGEVTLSGSSGQANGKKK